MMNKLLISIFLICTIYNVNCLKLENLCKNSTFNYYNTLSGEDVLVNSILRISGIKKLDLINQIAVDNIQIPQYWTQSEKAKIHSFYERYDNYIPKVIDEKFINSIRGMPVKPFTKIHSEQKTRYYDLVNQLKTVFVDVEKKFSIKETDNLFIKFKNNLKNLEYFVYYLEEIHIDQLDHSILHADEFRKILDQSIPKLEKGQSFVIPYENQKRYFFEQIFIMKKYTLGKGQDDTTIEYELILPMNNQNYDAEYDVKNCVSYQDLTIFYKSNFYKDGGVHT